MNIEDEKWKDDFIEWFTSHGGNLKYHAQSGIIAKLVIEYIKRYIIPQFKAEQKQTIVTDYPKPSWDDTVTHNLELVAVENAEWEKILKSASEMANNPSFDYGVPYWAIADFLDNIRKEYSITKIL